MQFNESITHYICPYNKFNIELVEKIDKMFSQEKIIKFLKLFYKFAKAFAGKNSLIVIALMQVIRDMSVINLENDESMQYLAKTSFRMKKNMNRNKLNNFQWAVVITYIII